MILVVFLGVCITDVESWTLGQNQCVLFLALGTKFVCFTLHVRTGLVLCLHGQPPPPQCPLWTLRPVTLAWCGGQWVLSHCE